MAKGFNIFGKLGEEINDFDNEGIYIVGRPDARRNRYEAKDKRGERGGYYHSQRQLLESIDLASASKFKYGIWDEEGQRKTYLNIGNFYRDVMKMKIAIHVVNYLFSPTALAFTWPVWLFDRQFKLWTAEESYDDLIGEHTHDLATYGTTVSKKLGECPERVPLRTLRNSQAAKSLYHAASSGGYAIIENDFHYNQIVDYPDWNIEGLDKTKTFNIFERYALVPSGLFKKWKTMTSQQVQEYTMTDDEDMVLAIAVINRGGNADGSDGLLFLEKLDSETWPLEECHVERVDGRWIGRGEWEKQLENQIARNLNANYRRRGILWAAKKVFQSTDETIQENLVYEVHDGQVLHPKPNGQITQVNTANQHTGEISNDDSEVKENSQQQAFAFEVATGESLPSGTPFRLGVVLSQAVSSHFSEIRKTYSNFLDRSLFSQIIPACERDNRNEHEVLIALGEDNLEAFKDDIVNYHVNERYFSKLISMGPGNPLPNMQLIQMQVEKELARNAYAAILAPKNFYENARKFMRLNLVDDTSADISDLTTLYQAMSAKGDPRADHVLGEIFALRGKALPSIVGAKIAPPALPLQPAKPKSTPVTPEAIGVPIADTAGPNA